MTPTPTHPVCMFSPSPGEANPESILKVMVDLAVWTWKLLEEMGCVLPTENQALVRCAELPNDLQEGFHYL